MSFCVDHPDNPGLRPIGVWALGAAYTKSRGADRGPGQSLFTAQLGSIAIRPRIRTRTTMNMWQAVLNEVAEKAFVKQARM